MSIHPSFKRNKWNTKRSVRKRWERIQKLQRNLEWLKKNLSVYGLPKEKITRLKLKIKKEKEVKKIVPLYTSPTEDKKKKKISKDDRKMSRK